MIVGCSQAPVIVGFTLEPSSTSHGERVLNVNGLFRKGDYCVSINLKGPNAMVVWEMSDLKKYKIPENVDIKYEVEIPAIGYKTKQVLLSNSDNYLVASYNEPASFQSFNLTVEDIPSYRAEVSIKVTYTGDELQLSKLSYGVSVSEWGCK